MQDAALSIVTKFENEILSVLLVKRADVPIWVLPGGGIDKKELPEHAAIRETHEESGLNVEIIHHVATYTPINRLASPIYLFSCRPIGNATPVIAKENTEAVAAEFFPVTNLPSSIFPFHKNFIKEWLETTSIPITRPLTEITYLAVLKLMLRHPILVSRFAFTLFRSHYCKKS